jgi:hypothetical protein
MQYLGDYADDSTVRIFFTTNDGSGGAVAPSTAFEAADIVIYKNNSATQKATTNGITMTSPFDTVTGLHLVEIDCSNDTGDAGFWATGNDYSVVLSPDETVDSQTVVAAIAQFSIENRVVSAVSGNVAGIAGTINTLDSLNNFDPASDTVANVTTVASVSGAVGSVTAAVTTDSASRTASQADVSALATSAALATAQSDLDTLTGTDGVTLATSQPNYAPNTTTPPTAASVADAVWDEARSAHTTAGSFGEGVKVESLNTQAKADVNAEADTAISDASLATASALSTVSSKVDTIDGVVDAILLDTGTDGVVLSTATLQNIADEILKRDVDNVEATANEHTLATIILAILESSRSSTTWTIKRTDGSTTHATKTLTLDATANPVTGVT